MMNGWDKEAAKLETLWLAGHFTALVEVVALFGWNGRPLPQWAAKAAVEQLERAYNGDPPTAGGGERNGRSSSVMGFEDKNEIHRVRWMQVDYRLGNGGTLAGRRAWRQMHGVQKRDDVFQIVSDGLKETPARGTARAIKDSYNLVRDAIKRGEGATFKVGH